MEAIRIGPLALPTSALFLLLGLSAFFLVIRWWEKRQEQDMSTPMWGVLITGIVVARGSFVLLYWDAFLHEPHTIFFLWQDGYLPLAGILAAMLFAVQHALRRKQSQLPLLSAMAAGLVVWFGLAHVSAQLATMHELPDLELADLQHETVALKDYEGQPMVINLWATWCPPCRREMPILQAAQEANDNIRFLFVNQREATETVQGFLDEEDLELANVLLDSRGDTANHFGAQGMPTTLFFDADGRLVDSHLGEISRAQLRHYINRFEE